MVNSNNRKGLTIIELLAAIVILGIVIGLIATTISIFIRSSNTSISDSQIQTEGLILIRTIESGIINFGPEDFEPCGEDCIRLLRDSRSPLEIELTNSPYDLLIGGQSVVLNNLVYSGGSMITVERFENSNIAGFDNIVISISINLETPDGKPVSFTSSNLFRVPSTN